MYGEIIAVGEEVLAGDVVNSNAAVISNRLSEIGVFCRFHSVVGDVEEDIVHLLEEASERSPVIILCGGLGPTKDDLTKESVAKFLDKDLYEDPALREGLEAWFAGRNYTITENNYKQALMPEGGTALQNANGTAPGVYIEGRGCHMFLLPGPPGEMVPMLENGVIPRIAPLIDNKILSKTYRLVNIGESAAVTVLDDIMVSTDEFILAPYAKLREVHLKATAIGNDEMRLKARIAETEKIIYERLGEHVYSDDGRDLVDVCVDFLEQNGATIATAESCTGGLIASSFVDKPGVSKVFMEGFITYTNASKIDRLYVDEGILMEYGAVSEQTAYAMAEGVINLCRTDYSISVTGIAGPEGGTEAKPVGLVYVAIGSRSGIKVFKHHFKGNREKIRQQSAKHAIIHLWEELKENMD